jgi:EmrB/QacA subfamily drug resistance transporter
MNDRALKMTALVVASLTSFLTPFMVSAVNVALPSIEKEFRIDAVLLSWVASSYLLSAAVSLVPFGKLGDIHGRKKIFLWGISLFTVASFFSAISISVPWLICFRIFQGAGSAMIFTTGMAILTSVFPPGERGKAIGINVAAVYSGLSCGPFFGGLLTHHFGWRSIFFFTVPLGMMIIVLILLRLKSEWAEAKGETFDIVGSLIYGTALVGIMYGISIIPDSMGFWYCSIGGLGILFFVLWEIRVPDPVFEIALFKTNRIFAFSSLAALIHYAATFAVTFLLSLYLQLIKGLTPQSAGFVLISQPLMMAFFSPFAGKLSDTIEPKLLASFGMALTTAALLLLIVIGNETSMGFIVAALLLLGIGFGIFSSPNMNAIMSSVEKRFYGIASGSVGTMRLLGQMFSMGIATLMFTLFIGRSRITTEHYPDFLKSLRLSFIIFAVLCFVGIFLSLARGKLRQNSSP